jgi:hypothetical protein
MIRCGLASPESSGVSETAEAGVRAGSFSAYTDPAGEIEGCGGIPAAGQLDGRAAILVVVARSGGCELAGSARRVSARWPFIGLGAIPPVNVTGQPNTTRARADVCVRTLLADHPNVQIHFSPTYSSGLNQVELQFVKIERHVLALGIFDGSSMAVRHGVAQCDYDVPAARLPLNESVSRILSNGSGRGSATRRLRLRRARDREFSVG